jgi:hypothetical protein
LGSESKHLEEVSMENREFKFTIHFNLPGIQLGKIARRLLPTPGNVIFTLVMIALLVAAQSVGALPLGRTQAAPAATSTGTIAYQGRLGDAAGAPLTGTYSMVFRLYATASGGMPLWEEQWTGPNGVEVSDGLFNVMLGSLTPIEQAVIVAHDQLYLGITVGTDDEMAPRVQLGSVPFATQALTVPDGSVATAKLSDASITTAKLADGAVTEAKLASPITSQSYQQVCLTPHATLCGITVSNYSSTPVGSNQLLQWTLPYTPFPHALIGFWGKLDFADDAHVIGSVPIAVVPEGNLLRCYAMVPSGYFNTVNSRVYMTVYGY